MPEPKILAVDDREENLLALRAVLEEECNLHCVSSGYEAIEMVKLHDYAAILLDVQMPVLDGFETAQRIRSLARSEATPIIFVTAIYRDEAYAQQGYIAGAVDYIFKPLDPNVLKAKINVFCELYRKNQERAELQRLAALKEQENRMLKEAVKARDEFLSIASHELRTPLTPLTLQIDTFIQLSKEENGFSRVPGAVLGEMLSVSASQVKRLGRLVNNLLDVSRIIEGRMRLERKPTDLTKIVRNIVADLTQQIEASGSKIELDLEEEVPGQWDPLKVEQVVINLLTNALKYGDRKPIRIATRAAASNAELVVEDRGIGIPPEHQARIFERFERAVPIDHYSGLGIGLFIANQMVQLHHGRIQVKSEPGQGSTFTVELPR